MLLTSNEFDRLLRAHIGLLDKEETRLLRARKEIPSIAKGFDQQIAIEVDKLLSNPEQSRQILTELARNLVADSVNQTFKHDHLMDDRPLYWARLLVQSILRILALSRTSDSIRKIEEWTSLFDLESRKSPQFDDFLREKDSRPPIVLTCFDPFKLDQNLAQSNPSCVVAMTLSRIEICDYPVIAFVFPVRFSDFNGDIVEKTLNPIFKRNPRLVLTISMGNKFFDLERFPGGRRSAKSPDNLGKTSLINEEPTSFIKDAPEFLEFTLPVEKMLSSRGNWNVRDNRTVKTKENGTFRAGLLSELGGQTAIEGSGGGYLSNEISYRTLLLHKAMDCTFPLGHLHLPRIYNRVPKVLELMVAQTRNMIESALN